MKQVTYKAERKYIKQHSNDTGRSRILRCQAQKRFKLEPKTKTIRRLKEETGVVSRRNEIGDGERKQ